MTNKSGSSEASQAIAHLDGLRRKHGANSEIGWICSNYIEQLKSFHAETEPAARANLVNGMTESQRRLDLLVPHDPQ